MAIRKFIEEIGVKILPSGRKPLPVANRQHAPAAAASDGPRHYISGVSAEDSAVAIRRYLQTRRHFAAPRDLAVYFNEDDAVVIIGGTVPDEETRELIVQAAGNIHGVERVDDRMTLAALARPV